LTGRVLEDFRQFEGLADAKVKSPGEEYQMQKGNTVFHLMNVYPFVKVTNLDHTDILNEDLSKTVRETITFPLTLNKVD
jgi:hypothetical protein